MHGYNDVSFANNRDKRRWTTTADTVPSPSSLLTKTTPSSNILPSPANHGFGEIAVDLQTYKRQGEEVIVGDFHSRIGKASNPNEKHWTT